MSMFEAAMRQELREKGRIDGFGGMSSAAWANEVRDYETRLAENADPFGLRDREPPSPSTPHGERRE